MYTKEQLTDAYAATMLDLAHQDTDDARELTLIVHTLATDDDVWTTRRAHHSPELVVLAGVLRAHPELTNLSRSQLVLDVYALIENIADVGDIFD